MSVAILLPAASPHCHREQPSCSAYVSELMSTIEKLLTNNPSANVVCGMDADDPARQLFAVMIAESHVANRAACHTFTTAALQLARHDALAPMQLGFFFFLGLQGNCSPSARWQRYRTNLVWKMSTGFQCL